MHRNTDKDAYSSSSYQQQQQQSSLSSNTPMTTTTTTSTTTSPEKQPATTSAGILPDMARRSTSRRRLDLREVPPPTVTHHDARWGGVSSSGKSPLVASAAMLESERLRQQIKPPSQPQQHATNTTTLEEESTMPQQQQYSPQNSIHLGEHSDEHSLSIEDHHHQQLRVSEIEDQPTTTEPQHDNSVSEIPSSPVNKDGDLWEEDDDETDAGGMEAAVATGDATTAHHNDGTLTDYSSSSPQQATAHHNDDAPLTDYSSSSPQQEQEQRSSTWLSDYIAGFDEGEEEIPLRSEPNTPRKKQQSLLDSSYNGNTSLGNLSYVSTAASIGAISTNSDNYNSASHRKLPPRFAGTYQQRRNSLGNLSAASGASGGGAASITSDPTNNAPSRHHSSHSRLSPRSTGGASDPSVGGGSPSSSHRRITQSPAGRRMSTGSFVRELLSRKDKFLKPIALPSESSVGGDDAYDNDSYADDTSLPAGHRYYASPKTATKGSLHQLSALPQDPSFGFGATLRDQPSTSESTFSKLAGLSLVNSVATQQRHRSDRSLLSDFSDVPSFMANSTKSNEPLHHPFNRSQKSLLSDTSAGATYNASTHNKSSSNLTSSTSALNPTSAEDHSYSFASSSFALPYTTNAAENAHHQTYEYTESSQSEPQSHSWSHQPMQNYFGPTLESSNESTNKNQPTNRQASYSWPSIPSIDATHNGAAGADDHLRYEETGMNAGNHVNNYDIGNGSTSISGNSWHQTEGEETESVASSHYFRQGFSPRDSNDANSPFNNDSERMEEYGRQDNNLFRNNATPFVRLWDLHSGEQEPGIGTSTWDDDHSGHQSLERDIHTIQEIGSEAEMDSSIALSHDSPFRSRHSGRLAHFYTSSPDRQSASLRSSSQPSTEGPVGEAVDVDDDENDSMQASSHQSLSSQHGITSKRVAAGDSSANNAENQSPVSHKPSNVNDDEEEDDDGGSTSVKSWIGAQSTDAGQKNVGTTKTGKSGESLNEGSSVDPDDLSKSVRSWVESNVGRPVDQGDDTELKKAHRLGSKASECSAGASERSQSPTSWVESSPVHSGYPNDGCLETGNFPPEQSWVVRRNLVQPSSNGLRDVEGEGREPDNASVSLRSWQAQSLATNEDDGNASTQSYDYNRERLEPASSRYEATPGEVLSHASDSSEEGIPEYEVPEDSPLKEATGFVDNIGDHADWNDSVSWSSRGKEDPSEQSSIIPQNSAEIHLNSPSSSIAPAAEGSKAVNRAIRDIPRGSQDMFISGGSQENTIVHLSQNNDVIGSRPQLPRGSFEDERDDERSDFELSGSSGFSVSNFNKKSGKNVDLQQLSSNELTGDSVQEKEDTTPVLNCDVHGDNDGQTSERSSSSKALHSVTQESDKSGVSSCTRRESSEDERNKHLGDVPSLEDDVESTSIANKLIPYRLNPTSPSSSCTPISALKIQLSGSEVRLQSAVPAYELHSDYELTIGDESIAEHQGSENITEVDDLPLSIHSEQYVLGNRYHSEAPASAHDEPNDFEVAIGDESVADHEGSENVTEGDDLPLSIHSKQDMSGNADRSEVSTTLAHDEPNDFKVAIGDESAADHEGSKNTTESDRPLSIHLEKDTRGNRDHSEAAASLAHVSGLASRIIKDSSSVSEDASARSRAKPGEASSKDYLSLLSERDEVGSLASKSWRSSVREAEEQSNIDDEREEDQTCVSRTAHQQNLSEDDARALVADSRRSSQKPGSMMITNALSPSLEDATSHSVHSWISGQSVENMQTRSVASDQSRHPSVALSLSSSCTPGSALKVQLSRPKVRLQSAVPEYEVPGDFEPPIGDEFDPEQEGDDNTNADGGLPLSVRSWNEEQDERKAEHNETLESVPQVRGSVVHGIRIPDSGSVLSEDVSTRSWVPARTAGHTVHSAPYGADDVDSLASESWRSSVLAEEERIGVDHAKEKVRQSLMGQTTIQENQVEEESQDFIADSSHSRPVSLTDASYPLPMDATSNSVRSWISGQRVENLQARSRDASVPVSPSSSCTPGSALKVQLSEFKVRIQNAIPEYEVPSDFELPIGDESVLQQEGDDNTNGADELPLSVRSWGGEETADGDGGHSEALASLPQARSALSQDLPDSSSVLSEEMSARSWAMTREAGRNAHSSMPSELDGINSFASESWRSSAHAVDEAVAERSDADQGKRKIQQSFAGRTTDQLNQAEDDAEDLVSDSRHSHLDPLPEARTSYPSPDDATYHSEHSWTSGQSVENMQTRSVASDQSRHPSVALSLSSSCTPGSALEAQLSRPKVRLQSAVPEYEMPSDFEPPIGDEFDSEQEGNDDTNPEGNLPLSARSWGEEQDERKAEHNETLESVPQVRGSVVQGIRIPDSGSVLSEDVSTRSWVPARAAGHKVHSAPYGGDDVDSLAPESWRSSVLAEEERIGVDHAKEKVRQSLVGQTTIQENQVEEESQDFIADSSHSRPVTLTDASYPSPMDATSNSVRSWISGQRVENLQASSVASEQIRDTPGSPSSSCTPDSALKVQLSESRMRIQNAIPEYEVPSDFELPIGDESVLQQEGDDNTNGADELPLSVRSWGGEETADGDGGHSEALASLPQARSALSQDMPDSSSVLSEEMSARSWAMTREAGRNAHSSMPSELDVINSFASESWRSSAHAVDKAVADRSDADQGKRKIQQSFAGRTTDQLNQAEDDAEDLVSDSRHPHLDPLPEGRTSYPSPDDATYHSEHSWTSGQSVENMQTRSVASDQSRHPSVALSLSSSCTPGSALKVQLSRPKVKLQSAVPEYEVSSDFEQPIGDGVSKQEGSDDTNAQDDLPLSLRSWGEEKDKGGGSHSEEPASVRRSGVQSIFDNSSVLPEDVSAPSWAVTREDGRNASDDVGSLASESWQSSVRERSVADHDGKVQQGEQQLFGSQTVHPQNQAEYDAKDCAPSSSRSTPARLREPQTAVKKEPVHFAPRLIGNEDVNSKFDGSSAFSEKSSMRSWAVANEGDEREKRSESDFMPRKEVTEERSCNSNEQNAFNDAERQRNLSDERKENSRTSTFSWEPARNFEQVDVGGQPAVSDAMSREKSPASPVGTGPRIIERKGTEVVISELGVGSLFNADAASRGKSASSPVDFRSTASEGESMLSWAAENIGKGSDPRSPGWNLRRNSIETDDRSESVKSWEPGVSIPSNNVVVHSLGDLHSMRRIALLNSENVFTADEDNHSHSVESWNRNERVVANQGIFEEMKSEQLDGHSAESKESLRSSQSFGTPTQMDYSGIKSNMMKQPFDFYFVPAVEGNESGSTGSWHNALNDGMLSYNESVSKESWRSGLSEDKIPLGNISSHSPLSWDAETQFREMAKRNAHKNNTSEPSSPSSSRPPSSAPPIALSRPKERLQNSLPEYGLRGDLRLSGDDDSGTNVPEIAGDADRVGSSSVGSRGERYELLFRGTFDGSATRLSSQHQIDDTSRIADGSSGKSEDISMRSWEAREESVIITQWSNRSGSDDQAAGKYRAVGENNWDKDTEQEMSCYADKESKTVIAVPEITGRPTDDVTNFCSGGNERETHSCASGKDCVEEKTSTSRASDEWTSASNSRPRTLENENMLLSRDIERDIALSSPQLEVAQILVVSETPGEKATNLDIVVELFADPSTGEIRNGEVAMEANDDKATIDLPQIQPRIDATRTTKNEKTPKGHSPRMSPRSRSQSFHNRASFDDDSDLSGFEQDPFYYAGRRTAAHSEAQSASRAAATTSPNKLLEAETTLNVEASRPPDSAPAKTSEADRVDSTTSLGSFVVGPGIHDNETLSSSQPAESFARRESERSLVPENAEKVTSKPSVPFSRVRIQEQSILYKIRDEDGTTSQLSRTDSKGTNESKSIISTGSSRTDSRSQQSPSVVSKRSSRSGLSRSRSSYTKSERASHSHSRSSESDFTRSDRSSHSDSLSDSRSNSFSRSGSSRSSSYSSDSRSQRYRRSTKAYDEDLVEKENTRSSKDQTRDDRRKPVRPPMIIDALAIGATPDDNWDGQEEKEDELSALEAGDVKHRPLISHARQEDSDPFFDQSDYVLNSGHMRDEEIGQRTQGTQRDRTTGTGTPLTKRGRLITMMVIGGIALALIIALAVALSGKNGTVVTLGPPTSAPSNQLPTASPTALSFAMKDWNQVGNSLAGETPGDQAGFSVSISNDGSLVAVGARRASPGGNENEGSVRVYQLSSFGNWTQIAFLEGESQGDLFGFSVSLSGNGFRLAVGSIGASDNGINSGRVSVFEMRGNTFIQVATLLGEGFGDVFGVSVSLSSNGNMLAVGAPQYTSSGTFQSGKVYFYENDGVEVSAWSATRPSIVGVSLQGYFGWSVSLSSDGSRLAVGVPFYGGDTQDSGYVEIYEFVSGAASFSWKQLGGDISLNSPGDRFGYSVSLSGDGSRVAIGAYRIGKAFVYEFSTTNDSWGLVGSPLEGIPETGNFGYSVDLSSEGDHLAVGAPTFNATTTNGGVGLARIYQLTSNDWTASRDILADVDGDLGFAVSLASNASIIVVGLPSANEARAYN